MEEKIIYVPTSKVQPAKDQPRKTFSRESLEELAGSLNQFGVLEPLLVTDNGFLYEIIAGERRWRAAKLAGLDKIPVIVKDLPKKDIQLISLIENIQRENLNQIEEANAYARLSEHYNMTHEEISLCVSKSRSEITNSLRLLRLSPYVQQLLIDKKISKAHARALTTISDEKEQKRFADEVVNQGISSKQLEKIIRSQSKKKVSSKKKSPRDTYTQLFLRSLENELEETVNGRVSISSYSNGSGKIEISYFSEEDFAAIVNSLMKQERL